MSDEQGNRGAPGVEPAFPISGNESESTGGDEGVNAPEYISKERFSNYQSEVSRKLQETQEAMVRSNQELLERLSANFQQPKQKAEPENSVNDWDELVYDKKMSPKEFANQIEERVSQRVDNVIENRTRATQAITSAVSEITAKFPEFANQNSEASQLALEKYKKLPSHMANTPEGARIVMLEAAAELGYVSMDRRPKQTSNDDDGAFSMSGNKGSSSSRQSSRKDKELTDNTLAFAAALGLNVGDNKQKDRLKDRAKRTEWNRYKGVE